MQQFSNVVLIMPILKPLIIPTNNKLAVIKKHNKMKDLKGLSGIYMETHRIKV